MAISQIQLARQTLQSGTTTLYTVGTGNTVIITNIVVSNLDSSSAKTFTLLIDDVTVINNGRVNVNDMLMLDLKQVLAAGKTLKVTVSESNKIAVHISGVLITP